MAKKIPLADGHFAIIDDEDFELVSQFKWHIMPSGGGSHIYAAARIKMHRIIAKPPPGYLVDHINGDTLDNRRSNLRICTNSQNQQNTHSRGGSSKYKGVSLQKRSGKWKAGFQYNGKKYHCGLWDTEEEAARAVDAKRLEVCGEFVVLNLVEIPD